MAVVDGDRVEVRYRAVRRLVGDLRSMGVTNIHAQRPRQPLNRRALAAAEQAFHDVGTDGRTAEVFEILHFSAWKGSPRLG
jgi:malonyl-CoA O-methyltransferase